MALSDSKKTSEYNLDEGEGKYNNATDVFKWVFITEVYSTIDENASNVGISQYTKVPSAGLYVQDTILANTTWTKSGSVSKLDGDSFSFAADVANPTTGKTLAIYNDTSANKDVFCFVDMAAGDTTLGFNYTVNAGGIATTTTNA